MRFYGRTLYACLCATLFWNQSATAQTLDLSDTGVRLDGVAAVVNDGIVLLSELDAQTQAVIARLRAENTPLPPMNIEPMTRDDLRWQVAFASDGGLVAGGLFPLVIEWAVERHPALNMQALGCSLASVKLIDPQIEALRSALEALQLSPDSSLIEMHAGDHSELQITLTTPQGDVVLSNRGVSVEPSNE